MLNFKYTPLRFDRKRNSYKKGGHKTKKKDETEEFEKAIILMRSKVKYRGEEKWENEHYHPRMKEFVMWQDNAWLDNTCALAYFEKFFEACDNYGEDGLIEKFKSESGREWKDGPFILVQQDNLKSQNEDNIKNVAFVNDTFIYNTTPNCTDCEALVDHTLGRELKNGVRDLFWSDFESSPERTRWYCNDIREVDWRIMLTFWVWQSWEKLSVRSSLILTCAKQVGFANCRCGCENGLLKLCDLIDFELGAPDDPLYEDLTDEEIKNIVLAMRYDRSMEKIKARRKKRKRKRRRS